MPHTNNQHPIKTVIGLAGKWEIAGVVGPVISVSANAISIDMSAYHRPDAYGSILDGSDITVTFPDDKTYTGKLERPGTIQWSNNSAWTKVFTPVFDLNGQWASGGVPGATISVNANSIAVHMSAYHRPDAYGFILDSSDITVNFRDDKTYTGKLPPPDTIEWSNNSAWTKVPPPPAPTGLHVVLTPDGPVNTIVRLGWTCSSDSETGFRVLSSVIAGPPVTWAPATVAANTVTFSFVVPNDETTYSIYVEAFNAAGTSVPSNTVVFTSPKLTLPPWFITVSKQGTGASASVVVNAANFTPNSLVVIKVTPANVEGQVQFSANTDVFGKFTASKSFSCVAGIHLMVTAYEDANPTGTISNPVNLIC
jgi:hypothetical protein